LSRFAVFQLRDLTAAPFNLWCACVCTLILQGIGGVIPGQLPGSPDLFATGIFAQNNFSCTIQSFEFVNFSSFEFCVFSLDFALCFSAWFGHLNRGGRADEPYS
jgi:hypothetical protein